MFGSYLKAAAHHLSRHRRYTVINMIGLATGLAVCLLIFLVIRFERSFDDFHRQRDHIYRVVSVFKTPEGNDYEPGVPFPTAAALRKDYPELPEVASILSLGGNGQITVPDDPDESRSGRKFREEKGIFYAEPSFFNIFDFRWIEGDKQRALADPNTVLLTRSMAEKYFGGGENAMGRLLRLDNAYTLKVTGILDDPPANTDFPFKMVISYATLTHTGIHPLLTNWTSIFAQHYCFLVLPGGLSEARFNKDLADLVQKYKPVANRNEGMRLLPLKDMHFDTRYSTFNNHPFSRDLLLALGLIGVFVLAVACVNFINLATAQAMTRSKEAGIRKVLGATRKQLLCRFLAETALLTVSAVLIAVMLCEISLPFFNRLLGMAIDPAFVFDPRVMLTLAGMGLGTTILAGFYPAMVLSGFSPVRAFKNKTDIKIPGAGSLRRGLLIFQFTLSQALVICVLIVMGQLHFFRSAPMGFDKKAILVTHIPGDSTGMAQAESLRNQLEQVPGIEGLSFSYGSPVDDNNWNSDITFNHTLKHDFGANLKWADTAYPRTYHLQLMAGRFYSQSDTVKDLVVNEAFLKKLGLRDPQEAIGAKVGIIGEGKTGTITGVVRDFHTASLRDRITPVIMGTWKGTYQTVNIRMEPSRIKAILPKIANLWKTTFPDYVYTYHFLDKSIAAYYKQEAELSVLYRIFAAIAILISCLGVYSLLSFVVVRRAKEIGIRKTLGASVAHIVYLFSKEFALLILVAFLISVPMAGYGMHQWLENYAFHIRPGPGIYLSAMLLTIAIAGISGGYVVLKAGMTSPVRSLQTE